MNSDSLQYLGVGVLPVLFSEQVDPLVDINTAQGQFYKQRHKPIKGYHTCYVPITLVEVDRFQDCSLLLLLPVDHIHGLKAKIEGHFSQVICKKGCP